MNKYILSLIPVVLIVGAVLVISNDDPKSEQLVVLSEQGSISDTPEPVKLEELEQTNDAFTHLTITEPEQTESNVQVLSMNVGWSEQDANIGTLSFDPSAFAQFNVGDKIIIVSEQTEFSLTMVNSFAEDENRDVYNFVGENGSDSFIINSKDTGTVFLRIETEQLSVSEYLVEGRSEFYNLKNTPQECGQVKLIEDV